MATELRNPTGLVPARNPQVCAYATAYAQMGMYFIVTDGADSMDYGWQFYRNANGVALTDLREHVQDFLYYSDRIALTATAAQYLRGMLAYVFVSASEPGGGTYQREYTALNMQLPATDFQAARSLTRRLFSGQASRKVEDAERHFVGVVALPAQSLQAQVVYTDGTSATQTISLSSLYGEPPTDAARLAYFLVPVGFEARGYRDLTPGKPIAKVVIRYGSETTELLPVQRTSTQRQEFLFWSKRSACLETLVATGLISEEWKVDRLELDRAQTSANLPTYTESPRRTEQAEGRREYKVSSGYLTRAEFEALSEICLAEKAWMRLPSGQYAEILITTSQLPRPTTEDNLFAFEFTYTMAI